MERGQAMRKKPVQIALIALLVLVFLVLGMSLLYAQALHTNCPIATCGACAQIEKLQDALRQTAVSFAVLFGILFALVFVVTTVAAVLQKFLEENLIYLKVRMNN